MMAGRNISATHVAFTSTRVMATCAVVGQAAGTAAALCVARALVPRSLAEDAKRVRELQQLLLRDDQTIRGVCNEDPSDFARGATVRASAQQGDAPASNVANGVVRDIPKSPASPLAAMNGWSAPMGPEGAWIELAWPRPQRLRAVQITFDSGFARELTLSASDIVSRGIVRGPQPETVRDYRIYLRKAGSEELSLAVEVTGNYQRLKRHRFEAVEADAVRVHVTATNGTPKARIFEIRCYG